ncbi:D-2-hydroxyacid dehydrogenase [Candidatus Pacebacteria bacterium]|nr:D-2-hydroxyacid dehydrogenase [Candidatus Paceibacterota bacterium]
MKLLIGTKEEAEWSFDLEDRHIEQIKDSFPELDVVIATGEEIAKESLNADICAGFPVRIPKVVDGMQVKWIHTFSAGVDYILTPEVAENDNIIVSNSSGVHAIPIAEHMLGMMIAWNNNFPTLFAQQQKKVWQSANPTSELYGNEVLIVGLGAIGSRLAELLFALGSTVRGVVRTKRDAPKFIESLHTLDSMDEALAEADYVINCLPGGPATKDLFNETLFSQMKDTAVFGNVGRGTSVNQVDLIEALRQGTIAGALLDVTTPEPLPEDNPLWAMKNVIITPHCSASSPRHMDRIIDQFCDNIVAFLKGEELPNQVNKDLGY